MDPNNPGETAACIVLNPRLAFTTTEMRGGGIYLFPCNVSQPRPLAGALLPQPRWHLAVGGGVLPPI